MPVNTTPRMMISIAGISKQEFENNWRKIALSCGFKGRNNGDISGLLAAIACLSDRDRNLLTTFLKELLTDPD